MLLQHGHFTWGQNAKQSYDRVIDSTNRVESWFADRRDSVQYSGIDIPQTEAQNFIHNLKKALIEVSANAYPSFVLDWIDDATVTAQIDQHISNGVLGRGVATPDHVIRIKAKPLVLTHNIQAGGAETIATAIKSYIDDYIEYFNTWSIPADAQDHA